MSDTLSDQDIIDEPLTKAISERFLQYALSTITNRALPDARDGLKPVQRRILYAMRELKLGPNSGFRKSAKISGDVMGNYHPHGDQAIYDALARMAQYFNLRFPLVDGQGNFGSVDGDRPASARYTEARLSQAALALMDGLDEDAVDFTPNYDDTQVEPVVLPAAFPNLLANGSSGIAVGMATNIPPHNIGELCDACLHLIKHPNASHAKLMKLVPGPDFPTGGEIVEPPRKIAKVYRKGRGQIRVRSKWKVEKLSRGKWQVVVFEIPFQVQKARLISGIAKQVQDQKFPFLSDIRDESAEDIRVVLEPKVSRVDVEAMMETLFRQTPLEVKFSLNMNTLIDGRIPVRCSLKEVLKAFLDHRKVVLERRSQFRLGKIDKRLTVLEGFIVAFLNLDRVIEIIRYDDNPKAQLVAEFTLTEIQAEAILNMRLRSLRQLEEIKLKREQDQLQRERADLEDLLASQDLMWKRIAGQIRTTKKLFAGTSLGPRRTTFGTSAGLEALAAVVQSTSEPITVICSRLGWIRALKGHVTLNHEIKYKDGDEGHFVFHASSIDRLVLCETNGRFFSFPTSSIPRGRGYGEPLRVLADIPVDSDVVALFPHDPDRRLLLASKRGRGFQVVEANVLAAKRVGRQVFNVDEGDALAFCRHVDEEFIALVGTNRLLLVLPASDVPVRSRGKGVYLQRYRKASLSDIQLFSAKQGMSWSFGKNRTRTVRNWDGWKGRRGTVGKVVPRGFPRSNRFE
ncbi:MAG: DNA topoisomerase IV subunit A [Rhodobacteraceae bacterium]|nr:DNA topoisomerase IV subunit A [Paracoccaceae bacterium]